MADVMAISTATDNSTLMKFKTIFILLVSVLLTQSAQGQTETKAGYQNFPIVLLIQFQNLSMPLKDIKSNFSHIGFGLGTEFSYTGKSSFVQQFNVTWHRNKTTGNGMLFYTQAVWRPNISTEVYTEVKGGAGYLYSWRPSESFTSNQGQWVSVGKTGKGMLALPVGISVGYQHASANMLTSPFITYQLVLLSGYNPSIPVVPQTIIQVGSRMHLN